MRWPDACVLLLSTAALVVLLLAAGCESMSARTTWQPTWQQPVNTAHLPYLDPHTAAPSRRSGAVGSLPADPAPPPANRSAGNEDWLAAGDRPWRYIVMHHSATTGGSADVFDRQHRKRGWDELGYHFVITNGQGGPDGEVQVGSRWWKQKWGAHTGNTPGNEYNEHGIGICLVGNFMNHLPTDAQLDSARRLVEFLMGTYDIPLDHVIAHKDAPNQHTECCGRRLHAHLHGTFKDRLTTQTASR
jgi:hypothetical protein